MSGGTGRWWDRLSRLWPQNLATLGRTFFRLAPGPTLGCTATTLVLGVLPVFVMITSGRLVDAVAAADVTAALTALAWFGGLSVISPVLAAIHNVAQAELSRRFVVEVERSLVAAALAPTTIGHLEDPRLKGRIDGVAEAHREGVQLVAVTAVFTVLRWRVSGVAAAILLLQYSWWIAPVLVTGYLIFTGMFRRWLATIYADLDEAVADQRRRPEYLRRLLMEPAGAKELRIFAAVPWLDARFGESWQAVMSGLWRRRGRAAGPLLLGILALLIAYAIVFGWLGWTAIAGVLGAGAVVVIIQAANGLESLSSYGDVGAQLSRSGSALRQLDALEHDLDRQTENEPAEGEPAEEPDHDHSVRRSAVTVAFDAVSFRYPGRAEPTLRDFALDVPEGQALAIVGENGAGKSTCIKLLAGLYAPDSGRVTIGGRSPLAGRRRAAVIFQDFGRYELSLRQNVAFRDDRDDDRAIEAALAAAGAEELLTRLTLDTVLAAGYPDGTELSGGQWQRVALARALYALDRGAEVLILDEPTAALDIRAETELFERLLEVSRGRTSILVSHRLNSVRHADRIVVIDGGRITEDGDHASLLAADGAYARMFRLQARRFVTAEAEGDHDA
ncbi:ABC transporter ATP-binding protein [Microlunatus parietis]|uniref:ATP-binding cassette subfamily B protein n=1 Tax=Microlunatus parietis TaxID=682979 RepID=A0A7Y9I929_9ACTN|nr:ABC transporter ATP-binding protein [Microlunatus parietis]NYE72500.1 ATP-binding cassette subfamily B protein [Microlunatus parietis]